jgi:hypothetical protein
VIYPQTMLTQCASNPVAPTVFSIATYQSDFLAQLYNIVASILNSFPLMLVQ